MMRDGSVIERDISENEVKIGKGPQNNIILSDASVSSVHAMISFEDGAYKISDLGSRNGTLLNDARITEPREIQHGDLIKMGHCALTFRLKEAGDTLSMPRTQILGAAGTPVPPPAPPTPKPAVLNEDALASALVSSGLVAQSEIERLRGRDARGRRLYRALIEEKLATDIGLRDLMSRSFNIPPVELKTMEIDASAATALRAQFMRERLVCPVITQPDRLALAVADPTDKATIDDVERVTRKKAVLRLATPGEITAHLDSFFTPRLVGVMPSGEKVEASLNQLETEIGKASHNRVVLSDPTVSSTHAIVLARDGGYNIVDLGSSNGTFVNGRRLGNESHILRHGDKIQLGQALLTFRNPSETGVENKTARLSLEALEEIRRRALTRTLPPDSQPGVRTDPNSWAPPQSVQSGPITAPNGDDKKKKKKDKDKNSWFSPNALSRIVAQVVAALITLLGAYYLLRPGPTTTGDPRIPPNGAPTEKLLRNTQWEGFSTGILSFGKTVEASGVAFASGLNGVLFIVDSSENEAHWMQLDENGKQVGSIGQIPLGINFKDPEALTYGNSFFYLVTSQSESKDGAANAIVRFDITPETKTLRGQPEVISDFRSFLLQNVTSISAIGAADGTKGGLNIEGIAWDPNNERLLIGLRSPQIGTQAVLVPLKLRDPRGSFTRENLKVDQPEVIVFPLEGHGVRDITYDSHLRSFLIISGAPETAPKTDFGLWEWNGQPDSKPTKLMTLEDKMKPEGVTSVTINGRSYAFVVGDSGSYLKLDYKN
jgi:pSer/pThr/pTyr-binding forkhead associated (FHA) protein